AGSGAARGGFRRPPVAGRDDLSRHRIGGASLAPAPRGRRLAARGGTTGQRGCLSRPRLAGALGKSGRRRSPGRSRVLHRATGDGASDPMTASQPGARFYAAYNLAIRSEIVLPEL